MSATFNDGSVNYGTRVESILLADGTTGISYVCESVSLTRPVTVIEQFDQNGEPLRAAGVPKFVHGSCTVQLATTATRIPASGHRFLDTFDTIVGVETFIVQEVTQTESQTAARVCSITFRKKYN